jgi:hypothetical protein
MDLIKRRQHARARMGSAAARAVACAGPPPPVNGLRCPAMMVNILTRA